MNTLTLLRVLRDSYVRRGIRQTYWTGRAFAGEIGRLLDRDNREFRRYVIRDLARYWFAEPVPVVGATAERAAAAVGWLLRAQQATPDDGVSLGWFPCERDGRGWRPSYPETTGYIITSLLEYAQRCADPEVQAAALRMARWEIDIQMPSGAVQGGPVCPPQHQTPAAFNTGMVLDGWCSAYAVSGDGDILHAARRAADFLMNDLDADGYFRTNGDFVRAGELKTYTCLCAWSMYRFGELTGEAQYREAAIDSIEAALRQQRSNGWFAHNCLVRSDAPLTHTIGYTLQGVMEVGALARRTDFIAAVRLAIDRIREQMKPNGYLPGMFYDDWQPARLSSCLTGSAQLAIVGYRLAEIFGDESYRAFADRLLDYLKSLQDVTTPIEEVRGALPGSFPLFGEYMRGGYPNWATKYLLDALLLQLRADTPKIAAAA